MSENSKRTRALAVALDLRKFEIDLYWKRAAYFWVFTGAALAGHLTALTVDKSKIAAAPALLLTSSLGLVFAFAWYLVNRASKFWQTNWESHVDILENDIHGPLYKITLSDNDPWWKLNGAYRLSVSKINQMLSLFVTAVFGLLVANTSLTYYQLSWPPELLPTACFGLTVTAMLSFWIFGEGVRPKKAVSVRLRETTIDRKKGPSDDG